MAKCEYALDHVDPKKGRLISGLDVKVNLSLMDWDENNKKLNRFVPYRVVSGIPLHREPGDWGVFLIKGEWSLCQFMGREWWEESEKIGHNLSIDAQSRRGKIGGAKGKGRPNTEDQNRKIGESKLKKPRPKWIIEAMVNGAAKWADPNHPELGQTNAGNLVRMQIRRGLPHGPGNRVKVIQQNE